MTPTTPALRSNLHVSAAVALDRDNIVAVGSRIARFDGKGWKPIPRPQEMDVAAKGFEISSLAAAPDGTLWMTERAGHKLWRRSPEGVWAVVPLPQAKPSTEPTGAARDFAPVNVFALPSGAAWVTGCIDPATPRKTRTMAPPTRTTRKR